LRSAVDGIGFDTPFEILTIKQGEGLDGLVMVEERIT